MTIVHWIILIGLFFYLLTCWAILDISRKNFGGMEKKVGWAVAAMIPFFGPIIYLAFGFRKGTRKV